MFKIIQISDLHFGRQDPYMVAKGAEIIEELKPDLIVVAGDLTQRNWAWQFFPANEFLKKLNRPVLIVPGNHDIPLYNLFLRFRKPLKHYHHYFNTPFLSLFDNDDMNIIGLSSLDRFHYRNGKLKTADIEIAIEKFGQTKGSKWNILVTHHPFTDIKKNKDPMLFDKFLESIDLWLAGHLHYFRLNNLEFLGKKYDGMQCVSGTFISNRLRSEENSFNLLQFEGNQQATLINFYYKADRQKFIRNKEFSLEKKY